MTGSAVSTTPRPGSPGSDVAIAAGGVWTGLGPAADAGADAVGVSAGRIVAVGPLADVRAHLTAGTFAAMSLWGYTTKKDLSGFGSFLMMGLIGIVIASLVLGNHFAVRNSRIKEGFLSIII